MFLDQSQIHTLTQMISSSDSKDFEWAIEICKNYKFSKKLIKHFQTYILNEEDKIHLIKINHPLARGIKIKYNLEIPYSDIEFLPEDLEIGGSLKLNNTKLKHLPKKIKIGGSLDLENCPISYLNDYMKIRGYLDIENTNIEVLPKGLYVRNNLYIKGLKIQTLPDDIVVGGKLFITNSNLRLNIPKTANIHKIEEY